VTISLYDFRRFWFGQAVSQFGTYIGSAALALTAILVLQATPSELGILAAAAALPALLVALPAGAWIDTIRRRPLLILADLGRALVLITIPILYVYGVLQIEHLYIIAFLKGTLSTLFELAYHAAVPGLVERDQLVDANSKLSMTDSLGEISGPGIGGLLVQILSAPITLLIDALSFLVSAWSIWRIRLPELAPQVPEASHFWHDLREGLFFSFRQPVLRALLGQAVFSNLFGNMIGALYLLYGVQELGLSPAVVGLIIGTGGLGSLLGALLAQRITRRFGSATTLVGSVLWSSLFQLGMPFAAGIWAIPLLVMVQFVGDIGWSVYLINETSLRQTLTPDQLLGRTHASRAFLLAIVAPLGAVLGGVLAESIGIRLTLGVAVVGIILAAGWVVLLRWRDVRE
jgi:predicted MFS family arabinose efflux permease